jgi:hypothetical protein
VLPIKRHEFSDNIIYNTRNYPKIAMATLEPISTGYSQAYNEAPLPGVDRQDAVVYPASPSRRAVTIASRIVTRRVDQGISLLALKQYDKAIHVWKDAMSSLRYMVSESEESMEDQATPSGIACNPVSSVCLNVDLEGEERDRMGNHQINDVINTFHHSSLFRVYDRAFLVPPPEHDENDEKDYNTICSAVVVYNLSLSYHLAAISGSIGNRCASVSGAVRVPTVQMILEKSLRLYGMALKLIESLSETSRCYYHATKLVMAIVNNTGQIHSGFCNLIAMQQCRDCILALYQDLVASLEFYSVTQFTAQQQRRHHDNEENDVTDLLRFFSFFTLLSSQDSLIAAAAA